VRGDRLATLRAALAFLHRWLDSWSGLDLVVVGMRHQDFQVSLGEHGAGQRVYT
jgi:hypothetical protein